MLERRANYQLICQKFQNINKIQVIADALRCKYKIILSPKKDCDNMLSYKQYLKGFSNNLNLSHQKIRQEEISINNNLNQQKEQLSNFLEQSKGNIYKNILKSFKKHIKSCKNPQLQIKYENLTQNQWDFQNIKRRIVQALKCDNRSNLRFKNLIKNDKASKIFVYYLENSEELWLKNSRLQDKEEYKTYIQMILKAIQQNILVQNTQHYHKKKQYLI